MVRAHLPCAGATLTCGRIPRGCRNQAEMAHTCRGTISLVSAVIHTEDSCNFVISNGGTQTFHLKASNEIERQKWVTALELAKARAVRMMESGESAWRIRSAVLPCSQVAQLAKVPRRSKILLEAARVQAVLTCVCSSCAKLLG